MCDTVRIPSLPVFVRAVIHPDRPPIVFRDNEARNENPTRSIDVEASIILQPPANLVRAAAHQARNTPSPPAVHLKRPKVLGAVGIGNRRTNPPTLLIPQPPKRSRKPRPPSRRSLDAGRDSGFLRPDSGNSRVAVNGAADQQESAKAGDPKHRTPHLSGPDHEAAAADRATLPLPAVAPCSACRRSGVIPAMR